MNQIKIGCFIKELRKEKQLTQQKVAEIFLVSDRTVSRWETGSNLPDIEILVEMADFYEVSLKELLEGERSNTKLNKELEETVLQVADYSQDLKEKLIKRFHYLFIVGLVSFIIYLWLLFFVDIQGNSIIDFLSGLSLGISFGTAILGVIFTSKHAEKIREAKLSVKKKMLG